MAIDDTDDLNAEAVPTPDAAETVFGLFRDERFLVVELDAEGTLVRCNPGYMAACGRDAAALSGRYPPDVLSVRLPAGAGTPAPTRYPFVSREEWVAGGAGTRRIHWLKLWSCRDGDAERYVKLGVLDNGASAKPAEQHNQLEAFLDAAPDAIITINERGIMISANPATEHLFGYPSSELIGRNVSVLMPSPDREHHDQYLEHYLRTGEARIIGVGRDITARRRDGTTFPARLSVSEFTAQGERYFTGILHDITERIEAQEQQRAMFAEHAHASRVVALGEMASSIAHEINQPLTAIVSYADASRKLIEMGRHDTETLSHALKEISGQGQRAGEIIRRLREFVKKKAPARSSSDINEIVRTATAFTAHDVERYGIDLELELQPGPLPARVDRLQIEQVVLNLVRNSVEAIKESGCQDGRIRVESRLDNGLLTISVSDNGPGIKPSEYVDVFNAFYTTKETGTGLGLSISHSILEAHGGQLTFRPNADGGVTFLMSLPAHGDD